MVDNTVKCIPSSKFVLLKWFMKYPLMKLKYKYFTFFGITILNRSVYASQSRLVCILYKNRTKCERL